MTVTLTTARSLEGIYHFETRSVLHDDRGDDDDDGRNNSNQNLAWQASQALMRSPHVKEFVAERDTQNEPEQEPQLDAPEPTPSESSEARPATELPVEREAPEDGEEFDDDDDCHHANEDEGDAEQEELCKEQYPTLEEYKARWARLLEQHARPVEGVFSRENLTPQPIHELWQDCPYLLDQKT